MTPLFIAIIIVGLITFLIGYWFLGKSSGEKECNPPVSSSGNTVGGWIGILLGLIIMIIGVYYGLQSEQV
jgi:amino acid transporter